MQEVLINGRQLVGELGVQVFDDRLITQHLPHLHLKPDDRAHPPRPVAPVISVRSLTGALHLESVVPQELQHGKDTPTTLDAAGAGRVHFTRPLAPGRRHDLL